MLEGYLSKSTKSSALWKRAKDVFSGGVNHNIRTFGMVTCGAYPPFMAQGNGSRIWDVDGNEYVDWWMTHYSEILGHNNPSVKKAIVRQLDNGVHLGALNEHQVVLAERIKQAIPVMEKMRFCTTGSESTMYAARLARLFTGRPLVAKALGGWHGGNDALSYHLGYPFTDEPLYDGMSFDYNDRDSVDRLIKEHGSQLAAIIVEPVLGAGGAIPPEPDFLPYLREVTQQHDILLIFDEIVTGFRLSYGDAGTRVFGVKPDMLTLGKVAGGGMPLGVYGGREDIMALAAPGAVGGRWVGGGTFSSHPLTMVAGIAALTELESRKAAYPQLNSRGDRFRRSINEIFHATGFSGLATGLGSITFITMLSEQVQTDHLTGSVLGKAMDHHRQDIFQGLLMERGVFGYHGLGAMSFAHTDADVKTTLQAVSDTVRDSHLHVKPEPKH